MRTSKRTRLNKLRALQKAVEYALSDSLYHFDRSHPFLPLAVPSYSSEEVLEAIDSLISTRVTMGEKVFKFEEKFATYIGRKYGVMVNSGSSANLVACSVLTNRLLGDHLTSGFEGIVPAVTWPTTMFPISDRGGVPVLCDVDSETFNLTNRLAETGMSERTRMIVPVHLLGNPCDVESIRSVLPNESIKIVEDSCEAHGAEIAGRKVGSFGDIGTFSFYFSHHITTIEGGILLVDEEEVAEVARMVRAHGWIRDLDSRDYYAKKYPTIDPRFLFPSSGFNLRPTEIQGAFGLHQLKRLERFVDARRSNARYLGRRLKKYDRYIRVQEERSGTRHVWFGYPVTVMPNATFARNDLVAFLEKSGIQTRPIMAGNLAQQPASSIIEHRIAGPLSVSQRVMQDSFFFGIHQYLPKEALDYVVSCFETFFTSVGRRS